MHRPEVRQECTGPKLDRKLLVQTKGCSNYRPLLWAGFSYLPPPHSRQRHSIRCQAAVNGIVGSKRFSGRGSS